VKRLVKLGAGAALAAMAAGAWALYLLRSSLPEWSGTASVRGLEGAIEIVRDAHAVPHVFASSEADAYFGLGYVHAQDRLWQLELSRRLGSGSLAEIFGSDALDQDRLFRTLGLRGVAERNLAALSERARAALDAYARGVNAFLDSGAALPPEFRLLRFEPARWSPTDSLVWLEVMGWWMSSSVGRELLRSRLAERLSPRQLAEFFAPYPGEPALSLGDLSQLYGELSLSAASRCSPMTRTWS
jgi:penicillin amidase